MQVLKFILFQYKSGYFIFQYVIFFSSDTILSTNAILLFSQKLQIYRSLNLRPWIINFTGFWI